MKLREYQAKEIFRKYGIKTPGGAVAEDSAQALRIAEKLGTPVVLKPQLGVKGRAKVGGIAFAEGPAAAEKNAERPFDMTIKGEPVRVLLVEEKLAIASEMYVAVTIDHMARCPVIIVSPDGGVDIESVAHSAPERVLKIPLNILDGLTSNDLTRVSDFMGDEIAALVKILYRIFREFDAELVEINPVIRTTEGDLYAVDAVLNINQDSLFRHNELDKYHSEIPISDPLESEATARNWTYIRLTGEIGILSSGAGLTMAILDMIHQKGGRAANFLDTAQMDDQGIFDAFEFLRRASGKSLILVNIFAGLNRCDLLAMGIRDYLERHPMDIPVVVRMVGNMEVEGHRILQDIGIEPFNSLEDAVERAVKLSQGDVS